MVNVEGAYCATEDMRTGDLAVPSYTSKEQYVKTASEEIETALGHLYVTPFVVEEVSANRPTILYLKKLNWLLASGRFILDVAAAGESDNLHAYGKRMLDEATAMLKPVLAKDTVLTGAPLIDGNQQSNFGGPMIHNEDAESLVEGFYRNQRPGYVGLGESLPMGGRRPVVPYGE